MSSPQRAIKILGAGPHSHLCPRYLDFQVPSHLPTSERKPEDGLGAGKTIYPSPRWPPHLTTQGVETDHRFAHLNLHTHTYTRLIDTAINYHTLLVPQSL